MSESIRRNEHIRLNDGRAMILDASKLEEGKYEVMLFDPKTGNEVDSATTSTEEDAMLQFERLEKMYHTPGVMPAELKGRYKKLAEDLKAALAYGLERKGDDDGGTCYGKAPSLLLPRWGRKKVEAAAEYAGFKCFIWNSCGIKFYVFPIRQDIGQGYARTRAAEAMCEYLKGLGYNALTF